MASRPALVRSVLVIGLLLAAMGGLAVWRLAAVTPAPATIGPASLFDFTVTELGGHDAPLSVYRGQVALVVNVATECGLAGQYPELERLYRTYKDRGFVVLAFPSNDFWQEPLRNAEIRQVCDARGVSYPVFGLSHVRGAGQSPVYAFLSATGETPLWNFAKYLVGRDGRPRVFFGSLISPASPTLTSAVERALAEPMKDDLRR